MRSLQLLLLLLLPLAAATHLPAQRTWIVDCTGPSWSHFTDLPPAVAAAAPGDMIYLYWSHGCTQPYTAPVIDKPLRIVGVTPFGVVGTPFAAHIAGRLIVQGIPSGGEVVLSHLSVAADNAWLPSPPWVLPHGIEVRNCAGEVYLHHVSYNGVNQVNGVDGGLNPPDSGG